MKIFYKIRNKIFKFLLYFKYRKNNISPQGEQFIKYIIDFYINCSIDEPTEWFENIITQKEAINHTSEQFLERLDVKTEEERKNAIHYDTAMKLLIGMLIISKDKEKWLQYINDPKIVDLLISIIH